MNSPKMSERPVAPSEPRRVSDRAVHVLARTLDGVADVPAEREVRGNGRRVRAAGPVRVDRLDARPAQLERVPVADDDVDDLGTVEVPPLDQYDARSERVDPARGVVHVRDAADS